MDEQEIVSAFQDVEMTLIKSMRNTMRRHCKEEYDEGINWTQWQAEMLRGLDEYKKSSAEVLPGYFSTINDEITGAIRDAHAQGGMEQEVEILRAIRDGYEAPSKPSTKRTTQASFFSVNDKKLNALIKATNNDMKKAETAVLRMANDTYRKTMVKAQMHYNAGATNMWQAVDMATKDFLNQGINCIQYANGNRVNIASYAEMALRTSNKRANLMGQAKKRDEWGIHTVIVSAHGGCCPRCMQWQGNVYIDDVHGAGNAKEARATGYPLLSKAVAGGLLHPMCKHGVSTYYEGINSKPKEPTRAQTDESLRKYSLEQKQRYYERNYRRNMRLANGTQDDATAAMYRGRAANCRRDLQNLVAKNPDVLVYDRQRMSMRGVLSVDNAGKITVKKTTIPTVKTSNISAMDALDQSVNVKMPLKKVPNAEKVDELNFFQDTVATFKQAKRPAREPDYKSSGGSWYWYTKDGVYRESDHWGSNVASCSWYLEDVNELRYYVDDGLSFYGTNENNSSRLAFKMTSGFAKWDDIVKKGDVTGGINLSDVVQIEREQYNAFEKAAKIVKDDGTRRLQLTPQEISDMTGDPLEHYTNQKGTEMVRYKLPTGQTKVARADEITTHTDMVKTKVSVNPEKSLRELSENELRLLKMYIEGSENDATAKRIKELLGW